MGVEKRTNNQYFSRKQIESGEMQRLLSFLMANSYGKGDTYNDIHIVPADLEAFVVEWVQVPWSHDYGGKFEYVDDDQYVVTEYSMPDGTYMSFKSNEEYNEYLEDWLKENPGWVQTSYGTWTNEIENQKFKDEMEKQMKETSDLTGHDWVVNDIEDPWNGK